MIYMIYASSLSNIWKLINLTSEQLAAAVIYNYREGKLIIIKKE